MYDELVNSLRLCTSDKRGYGCAKECAYGKKHPLNWWCMDYLLREAADAIEKRSKRETPMKITEIHVDEYYCPACGAENNCDQGYVQDAYCPACGQRLSPEPPKEEPYEKSL